MSKKYKLPLIIIAILLILCITLLVAKKLFYDAKSVNKPTVYSSILDNMESYGYTLDDQDSDLFKEKYYALKDILSSDEIDYDKYGENLSELFVIDLYTISTKINKYDVGGVEYIYESEKEMFKNKVIDTLYENVEDNSYGSRKQQLPEVKEVTLDTKEEIDFKIDDKKLEGKKYTFEIAYVKDLGYDTRAEIVVVKDEERMYVVEFSSSNK